MKEVASEAPQPSLVFELERLLKPTTPAASLKRYVDRIIIPQMNIRRGRNGNMSHSQTLDKMFSNDPQKPGELVEFMNSLYQNTASFTRDPTDVALEVADLVYYGRQPNLRPFFRNQKPIFEGNGLTYGDALAFCCLKYSVRLRNINPQESHHEEYKTMRWYLGERGPRSFLDRNLDGRLYYVGEDI